MVRAMKKRWYIWGFGIVLMLLGNHLASLILWVLGIILAVSSFIFDLLDYLIGEELKQKSGKKAELGSKNE
jgi:hypothetical protein